MHAINSHQPSALNQSADPQQLRMDAACLQACSAIAPAWPLDQSIAVNPYWNRIQRPLRQVAARMAVLGNIQVLPTRHHLRDAWQAGRICMADLLQALEQLPAAQQANLDATRCIAALNEPRTIKPLPLLIDVLDDDPERGKRLSWREAITHQVSQTCAAYFDDLQANWKPDRSQGLYAFWRETLTHDHGIGVLMGLPHLGKSLNKLPRTAQDAERWAFQSLALPEAVWAEYLESVLLTVNGWASWCAYLGWQASHQGQSDPHLRELLAIRLAWGAILLDCKDEGVTQYAFKSIQKQWQQASNTLAQAESSLLVDEVWQLAYDIGYQRVLADTLLHPQTNAAQKKIEVQAAFCIDVRSEPMRRALENSHPALQTIGVAGFFGLPIAYTPVATTARRPQLPGLLAPQYEVSDRFSSNTTAVPTHRVAQSRQRSLLWKKQSNATSLWPASSFSYVEVAGPMYLKSLLSWIKPSTAGRSKPEEAGLSRQHRQTRRLSLVDVSDEDQCTLAAAALTAMGIKDTAAPLVLLVGHGSQSANNAHAASLDCGACCGQNGEVNVRVLAGLLNNAQVRTALQERGIHVPADTSFIPALHNTSTDDIEAFDLDTLPAVAGQRWQQLQATLQLASHKVRQERAIKCALPAQATPAQLDTLFRQRANDGAWTRPEWGLAGNATFVIAPRARTQGLNLSGRSFLHEYDASDDPDGRLLEQLMTAPMLVTHWINWQYHASTVDPLHMGSGNKLLHNVVGKHIGVFEGNGGDLRIGLSLQSLSRGQSVSNGQDWMHEPVRLTVVIDAPAYQIERIIGKHAMVRQLIEHGWLHLWRYDTNRLLRYTQGAWHAIWA